MEYLIFPFERNILVRGETTDLGVRIFYHLLRFYFSNYRATWFLALFQISAISVNNPLHF